LTETLFPLPQNSTTKEGVLMDSKVEKDAFEAYLNEARTWETSKVKELEKSKKTAWWVASASGVNSACSVLAVGAHGLNLVQPEKPG
jgi:type IV secretory pathway component VirB8